MEIETEVQDNQLSFGQLGKCTNEVFLNLLMKKSSDVLVIGTKTCTPYSVQLILSIYSLHVQSALTGVSLLSFSTIIAVGPMSAWYPRNPRDSPIAGLHVSWGDVNQKQQHCSTAAQPLEGLITQI